MRVHTLCAMGTYRELANVLDPRPAIELGSTWDPQPKQVIANELAQQVDETLYGGAAGGGKTFWLINYCAELMERHPRNRGVIFRRVFPSLTRTVIPRARELLHQRARWRGDEHTFTFPNGSVLELASLQYRDDVFKYYGTEYGVVAFEEITEFLLSQYEYLLGRLRAPAVGIRPHAVSTTNPGGIGHDWVKRRWIDPHDIDMRDGPCDCGCGLAGKPVPFDPWHPAATTDVPYPLTRVFVPARIEDNPALTSRDPDYLNRLMGALAGNRGLRHALAFGDWDAIDEKEGALVTRAQLDSGRVGPDPERRVARRILAVDTSDGEEQGDEYGIAVVSLGMDRHVYCEYSDGWRAPPGRLAAQTVELAGEMGVDQIVVERNHGGKWVPALIKTVDPFANVKTVWAGQGKRVRWEPVAALFAPDEDREIRAHLVGWHEQLENEMVTYTGARGEPSPNRLDALVWAVTELGVGMGSATLSVPDQNQAVSQRLAITRRTVQR